MLSTQKCQEWKRNECDVHTTFSLRSVGRRRVTSERLSSSFIMENGMLLGPRDESTTDRERVMRSFPPRLPYLQNDNTNDEIVSPLSFCHLYITLSSG